MIRLQPNLKAIMVLFKADKLKSGAEKNKSHEGCFDSLAGTGPVARIQIQGGALCCTSLCGNNGETTIVEVFLLVSSIRSSATHTNLQK